MNAQRLLVLCLLAAAVTGCDQLGIETPDKVAARQEAEGKAVGGACRHAGRALEDCYEMNRRASKAAVYAGWRDMDGYMRENSIAVVKPAQAGDDAPAASTKPDEAAKNNNNEKGTESAASKPLGRHSSDTAHADKATTKTS